MSDQTILLLGSGNTGKYVISSLLKRENKVILYVRDPRKVEEEFHDKVQIKQGDVTDVSALKFVIKESKPNAVIICSALPPFANYSALNSAAVPAIISALREDNRDRDVRLIYLGGLLSELPNAPHTLFQHFLMWTMVPMFGFSAQQADNRAVGKYIFNDPDIVQNIKFRYVRMGYVTHAPSKGTIVVIDSHPPYAVTFGDVAEYLAELANDMNMAGCEPVLSIGYK